MSNVVPTTEFGEWLDNTYPESIIRVWSDGDIMMSIDRTDMDDGASFLKTEDLPGDWCIESAYWSDKGVSIVFTRAINLDREVYS